jgi:hypothetical protein
VPFVQLGRRFSLLFEREFHYLVAVPRRVERRAFDAVPVSRGCGYLLGNGDRRRGAAGFRRFAVIEDPSSGSLASRDVIAAARVWRACRYVGYEVSRTSTSRLWANTVAPTVET